jgi:hypothetical protein
MSAGKKRLTSLSLLFVVGLLVSLSEPATFLDEQAGQVALRQIRNPNRGRACKVSIPHYISEDRLAQEIERLQSNGIRGILLEISPKQLKVGDGLLKAMVSAGVVWVVQPSQVSETVAAQVMCRPLVWSRAFGSAEIGMKGIKKESSAIAAALSRAGYAQQVAQLQAKPFKILFNERDHSMPTNCGDIVVACISVDDSRGQKLFTPGGALTGSDYLLDICQAIIDQRFLREVSRPARCVLAGAIMLMLGCINSRLYSVIALLSTLAVLLGSEIITKTYLPLGTTLMLYGFVVVLRPLMVTGPNANYAQ